MRSARALLIAFAATIPFMLAAADDPARPIQPQVPSDRPDRENPAVFARNKLPARATNYRVSVVPSYSFRLSPFSGGGTSSRGKPAAAASLQ
jgi:hypothetical protein